MSARFDAVEFAAEKGEGCGFKVEEVKVDERLDDVVVTERCPFLDDLGCAEVDVVGVGRDNLGCEEGSDDTVVDSPALLVVEGCEERVVD